jgi:hypothetical protein
MKKQATETGNRKKENEEQHGELLRETSLLPSQERKNLQDGNKESLQIIHGKLPGTKEGRQGGRRRHRE